MHLRSVFVLVSTVAVAGCSKPASEPSPDLSHAERDAPLLAPAPLDNPKELGWVTWHRDYDRAAAIAAETDKPLFLLFQEVPGCATCVGFGETVLSHPLVIEAIETAFVPVAIHNNKDGRDRDVLERFGEPSWNNPVVRFVDAAGHDLIPRADGVWSTHGIVSRMLQALKAGGHAVPAYLTWAGSETATARRATFAMGCYWSGEACLGDIPGVVATNAGWLGGREVVEVDFERAQIAESELRALAKKRGCGDFVARAKGVRDAKETDRKYHLRRTRWRYVPLSPLQASRVNAALARGNAPTPWLSPRQTTLYQQIASADRSVFAGLERPEDVGELARYERRLRTRLAAQ
jgi:hypothetical protein